MRTRSLQFMFVIRLVLKQDSVDISLRHWKALGVDLPQVGAEVGHQLPEYWALIGSHRSLDLNTGL